MPFDPHAVDDDTYQHLKALARRIHLEKGRGSQTIQPTVLLNEAWMRVAKTGAEPNDKAHFMATAAVAMRHVLMDRARALRQAKRGPERTRDTLTGLAGISEEPVSVIDVDQALRELQEVSPQDAQVVLLRGMGGLTVPEVAEVLEVSSSSVDRSWRRGRAFLAARLQAESGEI